MFLRFAMVTFASCFTLSSILAGGDPPQPLEPMSLKIEMDRAKLLVTPTQIATMRVSLEAPEMTEKRKRPPVNVCLVLDVSSSMSGRKIIAAKQGALEAIKRLGSQDLVSVVAYNSTADVLIPSTSAGNYQRLEKAINSLQAGGYTALFAGVSLGASELRKGINSHTVHRLVLLSDGQANRGPSSPEELGRLGIALSKEGISVSTLGLGDDYNEDLMTQLSQSSEGNTYYVEASSDLANIFQRELGNVLNVYAQKVAVELEFPKNVKPITVLGRSGQVSKQKVVIPLKQINGGQEKFAMVKVEVLDGRNQEVREMVRAQAVYTPVDRKSALRVKATVKARFVEEKAEVVASKNILVQRDAAIMENTARVDKALRLSKEGQHVQAAKELQASIAQLSQTAEANNDEELRDVAKEMDAYAADIRAKKLDKKKRKTLSAKNYQTKSQQSNFVDKKLYQIEKPKPRKEKPAKDQKKQKPKPKTETSENENNQ